MVEISSDGNDKYDIYEEQFGEERPKTPKGIKRGDKSQVSLRKAEIQAAKESRRKEAERAIRNRLKSFPKIETPPGTSAVESYCDWVQVSLSSGGAFLDENQIKIESTLPKVKAGGQHHQKNQTAALVKHLPTYISVRNEEQRSLEQNIQQARTVLYERLEQHLKLWKEITEGKSNLVLIKKKVCELLTG